MGWNQKIIWLSDRDVRGLLTMRETVRVVETAFRLYGQKNVQMPAKMYLDFKPFGGDLRAMPAYITKSIVAAGVKIVNSNPKNPSKGFPAVTGIMVLNDPRTGVPLGVFAAGALTDYRTGAAGGIAAKYLARKNSTTVGLVGCGHQAWTQLEAIRCHFNIKRVLVWGKTIAESEEFSSKLKKVFKGDIIICHDVHSACRADIIVTTTPVRSPLVRRAWVQPGTHINAIGADAPGKQELDSKLLVESRLFVDAWEQASHAGEINKAVASGRITRKSVAAELGEVVAGTKKGRVSAQSITVFDSTGLALQDVALANHVYKKALKLKKGKVLSFHG